MSDDFPTFERPINANSGIFDRGHSSKSFALARSFADRSSWQRSIHRIQKVNSDISCLCLPLGTLIRNTAAIGFEFRGGRDSSVMVETFWPIQLDASHQPDK